VAASIESIEMPAKKRFVPDVMYSLRGVALRATLGAAAHFALFDAQFACEPSGKLQHRLVALSMGER
jgi:hypothetical protein